MAIPFWLVWCLAHPERPRRGAVGKGGWELLLQLAAAANRVNAVVEIPPEELLDSSSAPMMAFGMVSVGRPASAGNRNLVLRLDKEEVANPYQCQTCLRRVNEVS